MWENTGNKSMTQQPCRTPAMAIHGVNASPVMTMSGWKTSTHFIHHLSGCICIASRLLSHVLTCKATIGDPTTRRQGLLQLTPSRLSIDQATHVGAYLVLHGATPCALSVRKGSSQKTWCRSDSQANYITSDLQQNPLEATWWPWDNATDHLCIQQRCVHRPSRVMRICRLEDQWTPILGPTPHT